MTEALTKRGLTAAGAEVTFVLHQRKEARRMLRERAKAAQELLGGATKAQLAGFVAIVDRLVVGSEPPRGRG